VTIRKGSSYGSAHPLPSGASIVSDDAELHHLIASTEYKNLESPEQVIVGLLGGDLCRTLGGQGDRSRLYSPEAQQFPVDLIVARIGEAEVPVVSHLIAGRLFGPNFLAVMNAQWWGVYDLGPKSHPGDGVIDITSGQLGWRQRRIARRRAQSGAHLPHPCLRYRRLSEIDVVFTRPQSIVVDSAVTVSGTALSLRVIPDAYSVVV